MTEVPRVVYRARDFATPQTSARLAALRFVLDCHAKKEAPPESRPDDAEGPKNDRTATEILLRPS